MRAAADRPTVGGQNRLFPRPIGVDIGNTGGIVESLGHQFNSAALGRSTPREPGQLLVLRSQTRAGQTRLELTVDPAPGGAAGITSGWLSIPTA